MWPDWAIYWTLGFFSKPLATINLPQSPTIDNFCKGVQNLILQVKLLLGTFYRHLAIFYWSHWRYLMSVLSKGAFTKKLQSIHVRACQMWWMIFTQKQIKRFSHAQTFSRNDNFNTKMLIVIAVREVRER